MTQARSSLIPPGQAGTFHCVQRCVRRAFLCGVDRYTGRSFEHRKVWVEQRLGLLAECFAIAIHAYAVMSNHLHLVVQLEPALAQQWTDAEVATRWIRLFPPREGTPEAHERKRDALMADPSRMLAARARLGDLSWLMRCLAEPIARASNAEDDCKGRFWEGRYKAQVLCDDRAVLAAMAYVDLNPIRAGMASDLAQSHHTSAHVRLRGVSHDAAKAMLQPVAGSSVACLPIRLGEYLALLEWTGTQVRPAKRGSIALSAPSVLAKFDARPDRWMARVKSIGSGYWRAVGEVQDLLEIARRLGQCWLKGVGVAAKLA
ncbi:transposase [Lysobacter sp. Root916]|uniref:transposase n=1 Tax=Lysobacter sp. Root916 TaxID=1736606 RepID=UPI000AA2F61B|nr:transposase [Lysobacter sp. Root916]